MACQSGKYEQKVDERQFKQLLRKELVFLSLRVVINKLGALRFIWVLQTALVLAACSPNLREFTPSIDHPANPDAESGHFATLSILESSAALDGASEPEHSAPPTSGRGKNIHSGHHHHMSHGDAK